MLFTALSGIDNEVVRFNFNESNELDFIRIEMRITEFEYECYTCDSLNEFRDKNANSEKHINNALEYKTVV